MNSIYAYIDEFGAFGFKFDKPNTQTHFIITAIIVKEADIENLSVSVEEIRKKFFQTGEMKSTTIGKDHRRRNNLLQELMPLPFKIFALVVDKRSIYENSGLRYKEPFYKFLNNYVHQELEVNFPQLCIAMDELGQNEFITSFSKYVQSRKKQLTLFDDVRFSMRNSNGNILIQVADIISGSLAYNYDIEKKQNADGNDYERLLKNKILGLKFFPKNYETYKIEETPISKDYDWKIANICFRRAKDFLEKNKADIDDVEKCQVVVLEYLLFRFMNNDKRLYIPTKELINELTNRGFDKMSYQTFRNKIIAKLRDNDVVISSSQAGYKVPTTESELYDFVNHGKSIIQPMLSRLRRCNDIIKLGTNGEVDLFQRAEYENLRRLLEIKE